MGARAGKSQMTDAQSPSRQRNGTRELVAGRGMSVESAGFDGCGLASVLQRRTEDEPMRTVMPSKLLCVIVSSLLLVAALCILVSLRTPSDAHSPAFATIRDLRPTHAITLPAMSTGRTGELGTAGALSRSASAGRANSRLRKETVEDGDALPWRPLDSTMLALQRTFLFKLIFGLGIFVGVLLGLSGVCREYCRRSSTYEATLQVADSAFLPRNAPQTPRSGLRVQANAGFSEYPTLMSQLVPQPKREHSVQSPKEELVVEIVRTLAEPLPIARIGGGRRGDVATGYSATPVKRTQQENSGSGDGGKGSKKKEDMDMWEAVAAELELQRQVSWGDSQAISIRSLRSPANPAGFWSPTGSALEVPQFHV